uniref:Spc7 domain-containing protein n=1 Tax=Strongyloides stercoralis TaxID=6248 RepID=A0A0K0DW68_STRER
MSVNTPLSSNDNENKRNLTPESDSGMNTSPISDGGDFIGSEIFDQNVVATSTPHRTVNDILKPPNILSNRDPQSSNDKNSSEDLLNTSSDSQKENFKSSTTNNKSNDESDYLDGVLYGDDPKALAEHFLNTNSFKRFGIVDTNDSGNEVKSTEDKYSELQQNYNLVLVESTHKTHTIRCQEKKIENLEALRSDQEKLLQEKDEIIRELEEKCREIPELKTKLQKDQLLKVQKKNEEISTKAKKEAFREYTEKIKKIEEEKNDLKRKLEIASDKIKHKDNLLEIATKKEKKLEKEISVLRMKPSTADVGSQAFLPNYEDKNLGDTTYGMRNPGEITTDLFDIGIKTPVRNVNFSGTVFTTPGIGDQTMWNKISSETKEMQLATEKLKIVVDFLRKQQIGGVDEDVKHKIIEQTTKIIDGELLKQLKKIIQPLQIFETLSKAQKHDLIIMEEKKNELMNSIEKSYGSMAIIAREYEINCYNSDGKINVTQFWNNLSLFISDLKKQVKFIAKNETKTTFNDFTPLPKNNQYPPITPKEVFTIVDGGKISPILSNPRNEILIKDDKENLLKDILEKYDKAKEDVVYYKECYKKAVNDLKNSLDNLEKKSKEYSIKEKKYENSINELKEIVEKTQSNYIKSEKKVKRAKKIIQELGRSYQNHFEIHHSDTKINSAAYDCLSVLKHVHKFTESQ